MLGLHTHRYCNVPVKKIEALPWFINPKQTKKLKLTAREIQHVTKAGGSKNSWPASLGISSVAKNLPSFVDRRSWQEYQGQIAGYLPTEYFLEDKYFGIGSSRHVLTRRYQIKGIGRNQLAVDNDYYHNWGGYPARDALRSLISDFFLKSRTILGPLETHAILVHYASGLEFPLALSFRQNDTFRLAQVNSKILTLDEFEIIKKSIFKNLSEKTLLNSYKIIQENYIKAFLNGVTCRALTTQNLTTDGRYIDTESIDFNSKREPNFWIEVVSKSKLPLVATSKFKKIGLHSSWFNELKYMCFATAYAFDQLDSSSHVVEYHKKSFLKECFRLMPSERNHILALSESIASPKLKIPTSKLPPLNYNLSQFELERSLYIHRYGVEKHDPRDFCLGVLQKTEIACWFKKETATLENSIKNWKMVERSLKAIA